MYALKVYVPLDKVSDFIKAHIQEDERKKFDDCDFIPVSISVKDDLTLEATFVTSTASGIKTEETLQQYGQRRYRLVCEPSHKQDTPCK